MAKSIKRLLIASAILFVVGVLLCIITVASGAKLGKITWGMDAGDYIDVERTFDSDISKIEIEVPTAKLNVVQGDELKVVASNVPENYFVCQMDGDTLEIKEESDSWFDFIQIPFLGSVFEESTVTLYVPANISLESLEISIAAGNANVENITAEKIDFEVEAGKLTADSIVATKKADLDVGAGKVEITNSSLEDLKADVSAGKLVIDGTVTGKNELDCSAGKIEINTSLKEEEYDYKSDVSAGSVKLNGTSLDEDGKIDNNADHSFELDCSAGSIEITTN